MSRQFVRVGPSPPRPSMRARSAHALLPRASQNLVQVSRVQQSTCGHEGKLPSSRTGVGTNSNARGIQGVDSQCPVQRLSGDTTTSLSRCLCCVCVCVCVWLLASIEHISHAFTHARNLFFFTSSPPKHTPCLSTLVLIYSLAILSQTCTPYRTILHMCRITFSVTRVGHVDRSTHQSLLDRLVPEVRVLSSRIPSSIELIVCLLSHPSRLCPARVKAIVLLAVLNRILSHEPCISQ